MRLSDPLAKKLLQWAILRSDSDKAGFNKHQAFIAANPGWPSIGVLRRRAEAALWQERRGAATVKSFFAETEPTTPKGRLALARALLSEGDRAAAASYVRKAWREDAFPAKLEPEAQAEFKDFITAADHKARMDRQLFARDFSPALAAAKRLGAAELAIAKAYKAVDAKARNAGALLDAVPRESRHDAGYVFSRVEWLCRKDRECRNDRVPEAGELLLSLQHDAAALGDLDKWWTERRVIARKLLDRADLATAYRVVRDATPPAKEGYRAEHQFTAGWIALRFLNNPALAQMHFARIASLTTNSTTIARGEYWQGRAMDALGNTGEARSHYQAAARFPTAYYGQIAAATLGQRIALRPLPAIGSEERDLEVVRAFEMLYAIGERRIVFAAAADLGERADDKVLAAIAEIAARHDDARAMLLLGKAAIARGLTFDTVAFPVIGVPQISPIGPQVDRHIIYSIVRQESAFDPGDRSAANAIGLMQVTPAAGKYVAKKFHAVYDLNRLRSDTAYNTAMGAAELGDLLQDYRGSYILSFAAYNAGRAPVQEWVKRYGDPRSPSVDAIDWVERIPFEETRNYVQRVLENVQVYRLRMGIDAPPMIDADLARGRPVP